MDEPVCRSLGLDQRKLPAETFERIEARAGVRRHWLDRERLARESFGQPGRDPVRLGDAAGLVATLGGWTPHLRIAELNTHWDRVVGADVARHSTVASLVDGVLVIRADSPAWATQLGYLASTILPTVRDRLPGLRIDEVRVTGPGTGRTGRRWVPSRKRW